MAAGGAFLPYPDRDVDAVVLRTHDEMLRRDRFVTITFVDRNTYWLYAGDGPLREYFRRVG